MNYDAQKRSSLSKPPGGYTEEDTKKRQAWLKAKRNVDVSTIDYPEAEELQGIIEYHSGFVPIPLALASPLHIHGIYAEGEFVVPLCTLEGALVMSMCRGMLATSLCGGIQTQYIQQEVSRGPAFIFNSAKESHDFVQWVKNNYDAIKKAAESTTRFGKLKRIDPHFIHRWVVLDMVYETGNAAGQNMVTIATNAACGYIKSQYPVRFLLESGFNSDKKASARNLVQGRGHFVIAQAEISDNVLKRVLRVSKDDVNLLQMMSLPIAHLVGLLGNHLHISNTLAAIYIATGQDAACVGENSLGHTQLIFTETGMQVHVTLPSLTIGTVGGGTRLPVQRRNLELLGCAEGEDASRKFAEIIAASTLCLELSLLSAISSGTFSQSHETYGRKK